jgi:hypothetical protein
MALSSVIKRFNQHPLKLFLSRDENLGNEKSSAA